MTANMFWNFGQRVDKVNELLEKGNPDLIEILEQDSFSSSVRNSSNQKLFEFLSQENNMKELLKWALSDEYKDQPKYTKLANSAVIVFSNSKPFQPFFIDNTIFLDSLKQFSTSKPPSSRACGHYQRIIESIANSTKGDFLGKLNDFPDFLIYNITDMALKDLFVLMATEFTDSFGFNTDLLIKLVKSINDENGLFVVSAIRDIIKNNGDLKTTVFDSPSFIDILYQVSIEKAKSQPLIAAELFRLLKTFKSLESFGEIHDKYIQTFEYEYNLSLTFQVQVFGKLNDKLFDLFFEHSTCSLLVEAIYSAFLEMKKEDQIELAKSCNLRKRIIENYQKVILTNARISDIAHLIFENSKENTEDADQEFKEFVESKVEERRSLRDSKYGGKIMNDDEDEDDEEEEEDNGVIKTDFNDSDSDSDTDSDSEENDKSSDDNDEEQKINVNDEKIIEKEKSDSDSEPEQTKENNDQSTTNNDNNESTNADLEIDNEAINAEKQQQKDSQ